jgi:enamine deaminase RidA (YjgF/YER057c/UK114 family)
MTVRRIRPGRRMSEAVIHNDRVYTSGLTADPATGSAEEQTRNSLSRSTVFWRRPAPTRRGS